jgi:hypothetical protein
MASYEVMTEDLVAALDQLGVQTDTLGSTQTGVSTATDQLVQTIIAAAQTTQAQVDALLGDLAALIAQTDQTATAADWTGPDSEQFRAANADLLAVITSTDAKLTDAIGQHLSATVQLSDQLHAATADFTQATQTATESTTALRTALQTEVASYDEAFAGSFSYAG